MEINIFDIFYAKLISDQALTEASLGRVYQLHLKSGEKSYGMITAYTNQKDGESKEEMNKRNKAANADLEKDIRELGLGFNKNILGHYKFKDGTQAEPERSFFISGITKDQLVALGQKYNQEAVIYSGQETEGKTWLVLCKDGTVDAVFSKFSPMKISQAYSEIKGRTFIFEWEWDERQHGQMTNGGLLQLEKHINENKDDFMLSDYVIENIRDLDFKLKYLFAE